LQLRLVSVTFYQQVAELLVVNFEKAAVDLVRNVAGILLKSVEKGLGGSRNYAVRIGDFQGACKKERKDREKGGSCIHTW
jgi:hypothetical protein